jgi:hypothetical protein
MSHLEERVTSPDLAAQLSGNVLTLRNQGLTRRSSSTLVSAFQSGA